jgi:aspartate beta-hydroxylase
MRNPGSSQTPAQDAALEQARELIRQGRMGEAEQAYARLLDADPEHLEALNIVATGALRRGDVGRAVRLLEHAATLPGRDAVTFKNLGVAYRQAGQREAAAAAFRQALAVAPDHFLSRMHLGGVLNELGQRQAALTHTFRAITDAQRRNQWLNDATTPAALRGGVKAAMRFVSDGRRELFDRLLEPLRAKHGRDALARTEQCLSTYLGDRVPDYADARQRPSFLYFPGLPAQPYFPRDLFPWMAELEAQTTAMREELQAVLAAGEGREPVYGTAAEAAAGLRGSGGEPVWDGIYFYRHGERNEANCRRCPHTAAVLDGLPLVRIREHAPEVMLSVLTPGSHILPHRGVTNTRSVAHLPLIVPPDCALNVGGELHVWQEGHGVVFDDTYEHEAWNHSAQTRVVLIADIWNPYLTEVERDALTQLVAAIGDFRKACDAAA